VGNISQRFGYTGKYVLKKSMGNWSCKKIFK
jgi:hypothetical protein